MKVQVRFFGRVEGFTRHLSPDQRAALPAVELPDGARISDLLQVLRVTDTPGSVRPFVSVNGAYERDDVALHDGDQVELVPPMAGGQPTPQLHTKTASSRVLHRPVGDVAALLVKGNAQQDDGLATVSEGEIVLLLSNLLNGGFTGRHFELDDVDRSRQLQHRIDPTQVGQPFGVDVEAQQLEDEVHNRVVVSFLRQKQMVRNAAKDGFENVDEALDILVVECIL